MMRFEKTFEVRRDPASLWKLLEEARRDGTWWLPGFESTGTEVEAVAGESLSVTKDSEPCAGTVIVVTFEATEVGAKVTVVQSGFPAWVEDALESFRMGWDNIAADFALFMDHGVSGKRHARPWGSLGCRVKAVHSGLEVTDVQGGFAEAAGLAPGDVLLALGSAPLVVERELLILMRYLKSGDRVEATWVRDGTLMTSTGVLSAP